MRSAGKLCGFFLNQTSTHSSVDKTCRPAFQMLVQLLFHNYLQSTTRSIGKLINNPLFGRDLTEGKFIISN